MTALRTFAKLALLTLALPLAGCQSFGPDTSLAMATGDVAAVEGLTPLAGAKRHFRAGDFGLAQDAFRRAIESSPAQAEAWLGLAATYDELRRFDLADKAYAEVLKMTGRNAAVLNNRGYSYLLRGDFAAARADLTAANALAPRNADILENLRASRGGRL